MNHGRGFTLIELVVTLAILVIVSTLGLPLLIQDPRAELTDEQELLAYTITLLRQKALTTGLAQQITINEHSSSYAYQSQRGEVTHALSKNIGFGLLTGAPAPPTTHTPYKPGTWCTFENSDGVYQIKIFSNGKVNPGFICLRHQKQPLMAALTYDVSGLSYCRRYVYTGGVWTNA